MAATTVGAILDNVKRILQEVEPEGIRWTSAELVGWLNEFYQAAVQVKFDAFAVNEELELVPGTRQQIPSNGVRLIDVVRNTVGRQMAVRVIARKTLDSMRRAWHSDPESLEIELFVYDDLDPTRFYVYPPAMEGARLEIIYSALPELHDVSGGAEAVRSEAFRLNGAYAPIATDYVLYRAFSKDAEHAANLGRAQMHYQSYLQQLSGKIQTDHALSPNAPDSSSNPPRV